MKGTKFEKAAWAREYRRKNIEKCREQARENYRRNHHRWKETSNAAARRRNKEIKIEAIKHYGNSCFCCGEILIQFLSLDHIEGNGNQDRKISKTDGGVQFYRWLKKRGWPPGFQVACHNCNLGRHINGGICPHKEGS